MSNQSNHSIFHEYVKKFKCIDPKTSTHLSLIGGKYNVSPKNSQEFYQNYYNALVANEPMYLVEKVNVNTKFKFFLDLEYPKDSGKSLVDIDVMRIIENVQETIGTLEIASTFLIYPARCIVMKREDRYHVVFPDIIFTSQQAIDIVNKLDFQDEIDASVYKTGLRMLGSAKKKGENNENDKYRFYNLENSEYILPTFDDFCNTSILYGVDQQELNSVESKSSSSNTESSADKSTKSENSFQAEFREFFTSVLQKFNPDILGESEFYKCKKLDYGTIINTSLEVCPFKKREHKRNSNPLYIFCNSDKECWIKCHDFDCKEKSLKLNTSDIISAPPTEAIGEFGEELYELLVESLSSTHYDVSMVIYSLYKNTYRVDCIKNPDWYKFDGIRMKKSCDINLVISTKVCDLYKKFYNAIDDTNHKKTILAIIKNLKDIGFKSSIMKQLVIVFHENDPKFYEKLDSNEKLLGFENGVFDFNTNKFRQGKLEDYLTFTTGYNYIPYDPDHEYSIAIHKMLSQILPESHILKYTLLVLAKALCAIIDEKFYIWSGISAANGKSTLINFLEYALGDYIVSIDAGMFTTKRGNPSNASPDITRLRGRRIFNVQELESNEKILAGKLKQMSGGDTMIGRALHKDFISFKSQGSIIMVSNQLPEIDGSDAGIWRRLRVTEFNSRFLINPNPDIPTEFKCDLNMKVNLKKWKQHFMALLIHMYSEYLENGIQEPEEVKMATNVYKNDNDMFKDFFELCFIKDKKSFVSINEVYSRFNMYWLEKSPNSRTPDIKLLKNALRLQFGREKTCGKMKGYNLLYLDGECE